MTAVYVLVLGALAVVVAVGAAFAASWILLRRLGTGLPASNPEEDPRFVAEQTRREDTLAALRTAADEATTSADEGKAEASAARAQVTAAQADLVSVRAEAARISEATRSEADAMLERAREQAERDAERIRETARRAAEDETTRLLVSARERILDVERRERLLEERERRTSTA